MRVVANDSTELNRLVSSCSSSLIEIWFHTNAGIAAGSTDGTTHQLYYGNAQATSPPTQRNGIFPPVVDGSTLRAYDMREGSGLTLHDASGHA